MGRPTLAQRRARRAYWRRQFIAWKLSGLTQTAFCDLHGLSFKNFTNWRGRIKQEDVENAAIGVGNYPPLPIASKAEDATYLESATDINPAPTSLVEVEFGDGLKVRFSVRTETSEIRRILNALGRST